MSNLFYTKHIRIAEFFKPPNLVFSHVDSRNGKNVDNFRTFCHKVLKFLAFVLSAENICEKQELI
jgi:hypothetical protein